MSVSDLLVTNNFNIDANSETLNAIAINPGSDTTLWANNTFTPPHLFFGSNDLTPVVDNNSLFSAFSVGASSLDPDAIDVLVFSGVLISSPNYVPTPSSVYTVNNSGVYQFYVTVGLDLEVNATTNLSISISLAKNGTSLLRNSLITSAFSTGLINHFELTLTWIGFLNVGDHISVQSNPVIGASGNITRFVTNPNDTWFMGSSV